MGDPHVGQRRIDLLGDPAGTGNGPAATYCDFLVFNSINHSRSQRIQIEGWLATRANMRDKLNSNHPFYTTPFGLHEFYPNTFPSTNFSSFTA
jgi:hypothetical protein